MTKQDIERRYFEMFCADYAVPQGIVDYCDKPDIIVRGERTVGIEVTRFYLTDGRLPHSEQAQSRLRERAISEAQRVCERQRGKRFELSLGFDLDVPIRSQKRLSSSLIALAERLESRQTGEVGRDVYDDIPELEFVWVNAKEYADAKWRIVQTYSTPLMSEEALRNLITLKEQKARTYSACDAYWLLVIVDFFDPAQDQEIRLDSLDVAKSSVFEKVIVYKPFLKHIVEIC